MLWRPVYNVLYFDAIWDTSFEILARLNSGTCTLFFFLYRLYIYLMASRKRYVCDQCQSDFSELRYLKGHVNVKHLNLRPFSCTLCMYSTHEMKYLKAHTKSHSDIRDTIHKKRRGAGCGSRGEMLHSAQNI